MSTRTFALLACALAAASAALDLAGVAPLWAAGLAVALIVLVVRFVRVGRENERLLEELSTAETRYQTLVERLPLAAYVNRADATAPVEYMSPQIEPLIGYTVEEQLREPGFFARVLHPDDRERVLAAHERSLATGEPLACEYRVVARDGRTVWFRDEGTIVRGADGTPSLHGFLLDVTERRTAEEALQDASEKLSTLMANVPAVVYRCRNDPDWTMEIITPAVEELTGYPAEDFVGSALRTFASVIHPDDVEHVETRIAEALEAGSSYNLEYRTVHRDGSVRRVH